MFFRILLSYFTFFSFLEASKSKIEIKNQKILYKKSKHKKAINKKTENKISKKRGEKSIVSEKKNKVTLETNSPVAILTKGYSIETDGIKVIKKFKVTENSKKKIDKKKSKIGKIWRNYAYGDPLPIGVKISTDPWKNYAYQEAILVPKNEFNVQAKNMSFPKTQCSQSKHCGQ